MEDHAMRWDRIRRLRAAVGIRVVNAMCHAQYGRSPNGRFLRHRFSPKSKSAATPNSLPKRNHVAKEAVSAVLQTRMHQRSERTCKPNDAPRTKPRPCVKTMLCDRCTRVRHPSRYALNHHPETFRASGIFHASCALRIARRPRRCHHYEYVERHRQIRGCCIRRPCVEH